MPKETAKSAKAKITAKAATKAPAKKPAAKPQATKAAAIHRPPTALMAYQFASEA